MLKLRILDAYWCHQGHFHRLHDSREAPFSSAEYVSHGGLFTSLNTLDAERQAAKALRMHRRAL